MKVEGLTVTVIQDVQKGTSKAGKEWEKLTFVEQHKKSIIMYLHLKYSGLKRLRTLTSLQK